ncbi:phage holin, LL-H family [Streptococcus pneumoniae]|nr:phage holin, LL-H family [Streptococcus pneumoniae]
MQQITEIIIAFATSFLTVAVGGIVKAVKDYLLRKGGEKNDNKKSKINKIAQAT